MAKIEKALLAGGCFWGVEELLRKIPGVLKTEVGYTGGETADPTYPQVKTGTTGHAEAIEIEFDSEVLPYERLLEAFFRMHDPTTPNRQGNDIGTQYRSAIFYYDESQRETAKKSIQAAQATGRWSRPISTEVTQATKFYSAEDYHQNYLIKNPNGYNCHYWRE